MEFISAAALIHNNDEICGGCVPLLSLLLFVRLPTKLEQLNEIKCVVVVCSSRAHTLAHGADEQRVIFISAVYFLFGLYWRNAVQKT